MPAHDLSGSVAGVDNTPATFYKVRNHMALPSNFMQRNAMSSLRVDASGIASGGTDNPDKDHDSGAPRVGPLQAGMIAGLLAASIIGGAGGGGAYPGHGSSHTKHYKTRKVRKHKKQR